VRGFLLEAVADGLRQPNDLVFSTTFGAKAGLLFGQKVVALQEEVDAIG